ncbi:hypothetical protein [Escherichia coli]|uniref:hypothetical protein n=1 Tax=Escherichia coli TaxID=562 RepID=UPI002FF1D9E9
MNNIKKLIRRSGIIQQRAEIEISKLAELKKEQEKRKCTLELRLISLKNNLFITNREICNIENKAQLFEFIRKRAILTYKVNEVNTQIKEIHKTIEVTQQKLETQQRKKIFWYKKAEKYKIWRQWKRNELLKKELISEENEQEEKEIVRKYKKA